MPSVFHRGRSSASKTVSEKNTSTYTHLVSFTGESNGVLITDGEKITSWSIDPPILEAMTENVTADFITDLRGLGLVAVSSMFGKLPCTEVSIVNTMTGDTMAVLATEEQVTALHSYCKHDGETPARLIVGTRRGVIVYNVRLMEGQKDKIEVTRKKPYKCFPGYGITNTTASYVTLCNVGKTGVVFVPWEEQGAEPFEISCGTQKIGLIATSKGERLFGVVHRDGTVVKLYDVEKRKFSKDITFGGQIMAVAIDEASTEVAVIVADGFLMVTDIEGVKPVRSLKLPVVKRQNITCNPLVTFAVGGTMIRVVTAQGLLLSARYVGGQLVQMGRVTSIIE